MITENEYKSLRDKYDYYHAERKRLFPGKNCLTPEMQEQLPESPISSEISAIETYEFINNPPDTYFAYINQENKTMTTWTGEVLGKVFGLWSSGWRSNFGDTRVSIDVKGINEIKYHGFYYKSAGDYCRIKAYKNQEWHYYENLQRSN